MATESFEITRIIRTSPDRVYRAWLDSAEHSAMTNTKCQIEPRVSGAYEVGDGYVRGATVALEPDRRIVQTWRASDFPEGAMESRIELLLERTYGGTRLTLRHSDLPEGTGERYREGWNQFYFKPMDEYFDSQEGEEGRRHLEGTPAGEPADASVTVGDGSPLHATIGEFAQAHGNEVRADVVVAPARKAAPRKPAAKAKPAAAKKPAARGAAKKPAAKAKTGAAKKAAPKKAAAKRKVAGNKAAKAGKAKPVGGKKKGAAKKRR